MCGNNADIPCTVLDDLNLAVGPPRKSDELISKTAKAEGVIGSLINGEAIGRC